MLQCWEAGDSHNYVLHIYLLLYTVPTLLKFYLDLAKNIASQMSATSQPENFNTIGLKNFSLHCVVLC